MKRLGIFCGTFNPIHNGHLLIAECARTQFALDKVVFVTSARPPHRNTGLLDAAERHNLVSAAVADNPSFEASALELLREGPSYTVDTVLTLKEQYQPQETFLLIGGDNLRTIKDWHRAAQLIEVCHFLVAPRLVYGRALVAHSDNAAAAPFLETVQEPVLNEPYEIPGDAVSIIDFPAVSISSSLIRKRLAQGLSVLYMVPKSVNDILIAKRHYI